MSMVAKSTSEICKQACESLLRPGRGVAQPANCNAEMLEGNGTVPQDLRTASRQMLIVTKNEPLRRWVEASAKAQLDFPD